MTQLTNDGRIIIDSLLDYRLIDRHIKVKDVNAGKEMLDNALAVVKENSTGDDHLDLIRAIALIYQKGKEDALDAYLLKKSKEIKKQRANNV